MSFIAPSNQKLLQLSNPTKYRETPDPIGRKLSLNDEGPMQSTDPRLNATFSDYAIICIGETNSDPRSSSESCIGSCPMDSR